MYRLQVYDANTTGMHWHAHKGGAQHYRVAEAQGEALPVAVAIGPDPAVTYAATAPLPEDIDEILFAGFLRGEPVEMVPCVTQPLSVPAASQIVLEGYVEPGERRMEGPFGDHTGYYSLADDYPVFHLTAITQRRQPHLSRHHRGAAPHGRLFHGQGHGAHLFSPDAKDSAGDGGHEPAGGRGLS